MATNNDLNCYKGEDVTYVFTVTSSDDISGWVTEMSVKNDFSDTGFIFQVAGVIVCSTAASGGGQFSVTVPHATTNITAKQYFYDVQRTNSGANAVLSYGRFEIRNEVLY